MKQPRELNDWDFSDTTPVVDGYDVTYIPSATPDNIKTLVDEYNNLVEVVNILCEKRGIVFDD